MLFDFFIDAKDTLIRINYEILKEFISLDILQAPVSELNTRFLTTVFIVLDDIKFVMKRVQSFAKHAINGALWNSQTLLCSA